MPVIFQNLLNEKRAWLRCAPQKLDELILPFGVFLVVKYDERLKRNVVNAYLVREGG